MNSNELFHNYRLLGGKESDYSAMLLHGAPEEFPSKIANGLVSSVAIPVSLFEETGEEMPRVGDIESVETPNGNALCLVRVLKVSVIHKRDIPERVPETIDGLHDEDLFVVEGFKAIF